MNTSDVQWITGKSESGARRILRTIRKSLNKTKGQFITIEEFAAYTGIDPNEIRKYLDD